MGHRSAACPGRPVRTGRKAAELRGVGRRGRRGRRQVDRDTLVELPTGSRPGLLPDRRDRTP